MWQFTLRRSRTLFERTVSWRQHLLRNSKGLPYSAE